ncbi:MAG: thermonuclease family protein [Anaerolineae bacterium]|jgi:endonuclease YncB( thermonuclease family)|nr:thermonuclease family protein [Anaerolineae bacterium]
MTRIILALFLIVALVGCTLDEDIDSGDDQGEGGTTGDGFRVVRIVDGDTIEVERDGVIYDVRYVGVNTPERDEVCYEDALQANAVWVEGREVRLERDQSDTDRFDRLLRYIYVDDVFVNEALVRDGWAEAVLYEPDDRHFDDFRVLEFEAAQSGLGCHPSGIFDDNNDER